MSDAAHFQQLSAEIERLLASALNKNAEFESELERRDVRHIAESERRDQLHISEMERRDQFHVDEMGLLSAAIESRDTIGQAKGVIMVTMGCTADEAFKLLKAQSQHENRKVVEVAAEIAEQAQRKQGPGSVRA
jgi:hypothetical protein